MCLSTVDPKPPGETEGFGYVVMWRKRLEGGKYESLHIPGTYELGEWYYAGTETEGPEPIEYCTSGYHSFRVGVYPGSFHIFLRLEDAREWGGHPRPILRCEYAEAHTQGTQMERKVIVANYRRLIEEV